jgi:hypothetical protein
MTRRSVVICADSAPKPDGSGGLPLRDNSVDAVVTDPPYNLAFMGRSWDTVGGPQAYQAWCQAWAREALRVMKPGGWLLAFGGTRTWHRLACGIEDAGFEKRDTIAEFGPLAWVTGQGFPKGKACLKPAWEPVIVARKPGSSVLQIDAGRISATPEDQEVQTRRSGASTKGMFSSYGSFDGEWCAPSGRWPANVVLVHDPGCVPVGVRKVRGSHDGGKPIPRYVLEAGLRSNAERPTNDAGIGYADPDGTETVEAWECEPDCPVFLLDQQSGERPGAVSNGKRAGTGYRGSWPGAEQAPSYADSGGASRFFYTAKADRSERVTVDGVSHPTVKPLELVRWLVRLVTPPSGTVLDLFCGSGTTGEAAMLEGFASILVDNDLASCRASVVRADPFVRRRGKVIMREGKPREEGEDAQPRLW